MTNDSWADYLADLAPGLWMSVRLTVGLLAIGLPLGVLLAVCSLQKSALVRLLALTGVELGRGFPALVILYLIYFGLPQADVSLTAFVSTVIGLGISFGAYTSDVFRAGLKAIPNGQTEAGLALGLSRATLFRRVLLPQAIKIVIPPLLGWSIVYFQATSLAYTLAVPELMSRAYTLATTNFRYLDMLAMAALLYAAVSIPFSLLAEHLGRRSTRTATSQSLNPTTLMK